MTTVLPVGALHVTFQRYPRPKSGLLDRPPTSWGALPIGHVSTGQLVLPLADGEAVWLGLSVPQPDIVMLCCIGVETSDGRLLNVVSGESQQGGDRRIEGAGLIVPPSRAADGLSQNGRTAVFTRVGQGAAPVAVSFLIVATPSRTPRIVPPASTPEWLYTVDHESGPPEHEAASVGMSIDPQWTRDAAVTARIRIVEPDTFGRLTGEQAPPPPQDDAAYKGWRLP